MYHLASCSTCQRIIKELDLSEEVILQNIKAEKITAEELDLMAKMSGSYESLFSRRAMKYKSMGLKERTLTEAEYRQLILDEYTFLKRPVLVLEDAIFVGNAKKVVAAAADKLRVEN